MLVLLIAGEVRAQSALDGFDPGANGGVLAIAVQADGKILVGGYFTTLGGGGTGTTARSYIGRLNPDGTIDTSFDPGANNWVTALVVQADGKILVGGFFTTLGGGNTGTTTRNRIARLNPDGTLDTSFDPGANNPVQALAVQADGRILVAGAFTTLGGGGTGATTRNFIGRLNTGGTLDTTFNPGANNPVQALAVQADGRILIGGDFTTLGGGGTGTPIRNHIGRLNSDGALDASFDPAANQFVSALAVQADGKILVGGAFTTLDGGSGVTTRNRIGRLNPDGTLDTSFDPGADGTVVNLTVQRDGKILAAGEFTTLGGSGTGTAPRNHLGRLNSDGAIDTSFDPGANNTNVYVLAVQADGKILVGGFFTTLGGGGIGTIARNRIGRLYSDGTVETNFYPGANDPIDALAVQSDGKVLVGGHFSTLGNGGFGTTGRSRIGRLNPDGTLDSSFNPGANGDVVALAVQSDGKILVGGLFTTLGGGGTGTVTRNYLGRLNSDGTLDTSFNPGADDYVYTLAVQADGKILVGGQFAQLGGGGTGTTSRINIGRLNSDGTLDTSFNPGANSPVFALAIQADGKILVGGLFSTLGAGAGTAKRHYIGRLETDGRLDFNFDPGANNSIQILSVQRDGKILVGGTFTTLGGGIGTTTRNRIGRVNPDGTLDTSFDPGANNTILALAAQTDGKILLGGLFTTLGGGGSGTTTRNRIGRLNPDGTLDSSFNPGADAAVFALAAQADGKILAGGDFVTLGGGGTGTTSRPSIGRLTNTDAASQELIALSSATTIIWKRSGASPEIDRATFEVSTDSINYTVLGDATRISGGWKLTGPTLSMQQSIFIRARGFYATGTQNSSSSIVESVRNVFITPTQLGNISTRLSVGTGNSVLIGGFIVTGAQPKQLIMRAIGPSLPLLGTLADPTLELHQSDTMGQDVVIASNDNWKDDPSQVAEILATGIPPTDDLESAIVVTLDPVNPSVPHSGLYTAILRGKNDSQGVATTGVALVEVYDLDPTVDSKLANISTRGLVQTDDNVMIGGIIVLGTTSPTNVVVRAIGPSLSLSGTLADPTLDLYDGNGVLFMSNDNWRDTQEQEIIDTNIQPTNDLESAILVTLNPGAYTAILRGKNMTTGLALVEAYQLDN